MFVPGVGQCIGRYQLEEELGRGGMAVVFRAVDPTLGRQVAIKVMHAHLWGNAEYAARFVREARAVAALRHPNIVEIYDFSEGGGEGEQARPGHIVSELVRGPTLRQFLDQHGQPLPDVAALIGLKLCQALECAHQRGIIHRDLKPENVMIAEGGRLVLTDFGIARLTEGEAVTQTGALIGSPAYMAPEQARGLPVDARADLFSLGVLLYLLCTGALPFPGKDPISTVLRVLEGRYQPPLKLNPQIGGRLDRVLRRLLQGRPEDRYSSAGEVGVALRESLAEAELSDADAELRDYFAAPGEYNQQLVPRVVGAALAQAEQARTAQDHARLLRLCDRVLALVPEQPRALELIRLSEPRHRRLPALLAAALLLAGLGATATLLLRRAGPRPVSHSPLSSPTQLGGQPDRSLGTADASQAAAAALDLADAVPSATADARRRRPARQVALVASVPKPTQAADRGAELAEPSVEGGSAPPPATGDAQLIVRLGPFCELTIDGKAAGRSPLPDPLRLPAGIHQVVCRHAPSGTVFRRQISLRAGQRLELSGPLKPEVAVRLRLSRGDAIRVQGKVFREALTLPASRYRLELLRQGRVLATAWLSILGDCTLVDEPELACR